VRVGLSLGVIQRHIPTSLTFNGFCELPHRSYPYRLANLLVQSNGDVSQQVMSEQLNKYHGSISEVSTIHDILPTVQTGTLHAVVYDLTESLMHVSFARRAKADPAEPLYAYERQFTRIDMKQVFAQQPPVV
jgi:hypothetical protein